MLALYGVEFGLMVLVILIYGFFQSTRQVPSEFDNDKLGRIARILGFFMKSFPRIVVLIHYLILVMLVVLMMQIFSGTCIVSVTQADNDIPLDLTQPLTWKTTEMQNEAVVLLIICFFLWIIMHIGGAVVRSLMSVDPYMATPPDPEGGKFLRIMCVTCGP
jgi:hypothetical protein